jgi:ketosteroid isomerase-like protein
MHVEITDVEEWLRQAMLTSDVVALDALLANDLLFTNHFGRIVSKQEDLAQHASGALRFEKVDLIESRLQHGGAMPVSSTRLHLTGHFNGQAFDVDLRFTRVWRKAVDGSWQLAIAHSSAVV